MASGRNTFPPLSPRVCFVIFEIYVNEEVSRTDSIQTQR